MAAAFPGGSPANTFVRSPEASGGLTTSFSRNPSKFAVNSYTTLTPVKKEAGYYLRITPENAARILTSDLSEFVWADGADAPSGNWNTESHEFISYLARRYVYPFQLGYLAVEQAVWKVLAFHAAMAAQQAMTARTYRVVTLGETSGTYAASHVATATASGGGFWSAGTPSNPIIKKSLNYFAQIIQKDTLGVVGPKDLVLVIDPTAADTMARSQEVHTYLKESPAALAQVRGDVPSQNGQWGLPDQLYGYKLAIEDTVRVSSSKGATLANGYVKSGTSAFLWARPGALVGVEGAPSFSTVHIFSKEEMTVESKDDVDNRRHLGRVVDHFSAEAVSPVSGALITNLFA